jgi:hypothetical protein
MRQFFAPFFCYIIHRRIARLHRLLTPRTLLWSIIASGPLDRSPHFHASLLTWDNRRSLATNFVQHLWITRSLRNEAIEFHDSFIVPTTW